MSNDELRTALAIEMPKLMVENAALREELRDLRAANEALRKRIAELEEALRPFAKWCLADRDYKPVGRAYDHERLGTSYDRDGDPIDDPDSPSVAELRRTVTLLASSPATPEGGER